MADQAATPTETSPAKERHGLGRMVLISAVLAAIVSAGIVAGAYALRQRSSNALLLRPSGVPRDVSTNIANLMALSPVPKKAAPGFTLVDQNDHVASMASMRGKVVVLEFMDPHCVDICPIVAQEFVDAYHDLGKLASRVVFAAVNVNPYHHSVASVAAFSKEHGLNQIPSWHFFTGPVPQLRRIWHNYGITVVARGRNADVEHSSLVYFISPTGVERFLAAPSVDHHANGKSFLPPDQLSSWGQGIAAVSRDLMG